MQNIPIKISDYYFSILLVLVTAGILLAGVYGYLLQDTARIASTQEKVTTEMADLQADITAAESAYGEATGSVTKRQAKRLGFTSVDNRHYVSRRAKTTLVSYRADE
jgi:hypothetical protein